MYDKCNRIGHNGNDELIGQNTILPGSNGYSSSYTSSTYDANGSMTAQYNGSPATNNSFGTFGTVSAVVSDSAGSYAPTATSTGQPGLAVTSFNANDAVANATTILPNGDILAVGYAGNGPQDLMLAAYSPTTGLPDTSFGSGGFVLTYINGDAGANAVTLQTEGTNTFILVAGYGKDGSGNPDIAVAEYTLNGALVSSFGTSGIVLLNINSRSAAANGIAVLSGGDIVVAGYAHDSSGNQDIALAEYNTGGTLVSTFGTSGVVLTNIGNNAGGNAILATGSFVYVAGIGTGTTAVLAQYNLSGTLERTMLSTIRSDASWNAIVMSGSNVLVAGYGQDSSGHQDIALAEYTPGGTLVTSFGSNGIAMTNIGNDAAANAVTIESGGKILVAGYGTFSPYLDSVQEVALVQYNSNGLLDATFGADGVALPIPEAWQSSAAAAVTTLSGGTIVVAGQVMLTSDSNNNVFVGEFTTTGTAAATYTYDVRNKMIGFSSTTGTASYVYDDSGNRVQETTGGTTSFYLTDTANPTGYAQPIEVWTNTTTSLSGATLNTTYLIGDRVFGQDVAGTLSYLMADGQGETRLITNAGGTVTYALDYDAFGDALNFNASTPPTVFLYSDGVLDPISGLKMDGDGTRDEDIADGMFIEMDFGPDGDGKNADPISLHKYLYAEADPVDGIDPSGHNRYITNGLTALHWGVAVDLWTKDKKGNWIVTGQMTFNFRANTENSGLWELLGLIGDTVLLGPGEVDQQYGLDLAPGYCTRKSTPEQDAQMLKACLQAHVVPPLYGAWVFNCEAFANIMINIGLSQNP